MVIWNKFKSLVGATTVTDERTGTNSFEHAMNVLRNGDSAKAANLLRTLADQGHPGAQCNLAMLYTLGNGVP